MTITNARIPFGHGWKPADIAIDNGLICENACGDMFDVGGRRVMPGFVDTHIHGAVGESFDDHNADYDTVSRYLASQGVTAFVPTLCAPNNASDVAAAVKACKTQLSGARAVGLHLEGPFISPERAGAINPKLVRTVDAGLFETLLLAGDGLVRIVTAAPELPCIERLITTARSQGVAMSMGHSTTTYEQAVEAIAHGFTRATHTFNAMPPMNHRQPGPVAAAMLDTRVTCEFICDLVHLHPATVRLLLAAVGAQRLCLISDAMAGAGLADGRYTLGGMECKIEGGVSRLADGTIAGSCATMYDGVVNLLALGASPVEVSRMASTNPATALGLNAGTLEAGRRADLVVLDDDAVCYTIVGGNIVYERGKSLC